MTMHATNSTDDDYEYHPPTQEEVLTKLDDWRQRLRELYSDIISWLPANEGYETEIQNILTNEGPMREADVPPQPVPELIVRQHGEPVLTFIPEACWIIGSAGRLIIKAGRWTHRLSDARFPEAERGWRLYRQDWPQSKPGTPFDLRLVSGAPFDHRQLRELLEIQ